MSLRSSTDIPATADHLTHALLAAGCAPGEWRRAPTRSQLAASLDTSPKTISTWLAWLEARRLLQRRSRGSAGLWVRVSHVLVRAINDWDQVPTIGRPPQPTEPTPLAAPPPQVPQALPVEASPTDWERALDMAVAHADEQKGGLTNPGGFRRWMQKDWSENQGNARFWLGRVRQEARLARREQTGRQEADRWTAARAERESTRTRSSTLWARFEDLGPRAKECVIAEARTLARSGGWKGSSLATRDAWRLSIPDATESLYPPPPGWEPPAAPRAQPGPDVPPPARPQRRTIADLMRGEDALTDGRGPAALKEAEQETQKRKLDRDR